MPARKREKKEPWNLAHVLEELLKRLARGRKTRGAGRSLKALKDLGERSSRAMTAVEREEFEKALDDLLKRDEAVRGAFEEYVKENLPALLVKCALATALIEMQLRVLGKTGGKGKVRSSRAPRGKARGGR